MDRPTISVACPTYNSVSFVRETLASVMAQTLLPYEIIISDDGSADDTIAIVEQMTQGSQCSIVTILKNVHQGPGAARNAGIRAAKGEWIAFLDSDDRWHPEKIEWVTRAIIENPGVNFFCHDAYSRFLNGREERFNFAQRYRHDAPFSKQLFRNCLFTTSAVVCRRDLLVKHGLFDETLPSAQDFELWLRLSPFLRVHFLPEALGWHIDRPGNISSGKRWRHFRNVMKALTKNRRNTKIRWYIMAVIRHGMAFLRDQLMRVVRQKIHN